MSYGATLLHWFLEGMPGLLKLIAVVGVREAFGQGRCSRATARPHVAPAGINQGLVRAVGKPSVMGLWPVSLPAIGGEFVADPRAATP